MRLSLSFMLFFTLVLSAGVQAQQRKVNLTLKDVPIVVLFEEIQKQTGMSFVFNNERLSTLEKVSVNVSDETVANVLTEVLKNTEMTYRIDDKLIVIIPVSDVKGKEEIKITGKVVDKEKHPLPGVTVLVKGTSLGVATDVYGNYAITVTDKEPVLVFSFIGMETVEVNCIDKRVVDVVMEENVKSLDDVVVTGYGTVRSSSFTGNAVTIKREDLLKVSKSNVIKALQTFDPSFRIKDNNQWGSDPNALPEMYIRGESGFGNFNELDRDPLSKSNLKDNPNLPTFIMDGFEISATTLYDFDINRIESITLLKDAAATALYGSRAANGVVVITTVAPQPGTLRVSYSIVGDLVFPDLSDYNLLNASEKLEVEELAGFYIPSPEDYLFPEDLRREYNLKRMNIEEGVNTYWLSKPLKTVLNHQHSLYIEGGSEHFRFGVDLQYRDRSGIMKGSKRDIFGAGLSLQYSVNNFTIRNNVMFGQTMSSESPYGNFAEFAKQLPYDKYKDEFGNYLERMYYWGTGTNMTKMNPLYEATLHNFDKTKREEFINNLSVNWNIIPSLLFKAQLGVTRYINKQDRFFDPMSNNDDNINKLNSENVSSGTYYIYNDNGYAFDFTSTLSFNELVSEHHINAVAGVNMREDKDKGDRIIYTGFPTGALSSPMYAEKVYEKGRFTEGKRRLVGFLGTVNYSYKNIYLADASIRVDGSSAFGADKRFGTFWSFGAGLNIHNYKFMRNYNFINQLKLRATYGQTGKANFPAYDARTSYQILTDSWYKTGYGSELIAQGNSGLTWETTNKLDMGIEVSLFKSRIYLQASYYNEKTVDLITDVTIPTSSGFRSYKDNMGEISNKGYEFRLQLYPIKTQDVMLVINANMAHNRNRIEKISESMRAYNEQVIAMFEEQLNWDDPDREKQVRPFLQYVEGGSMRSIFGVRSLGINPANGEEVFLSNTGDLARVWNASDQVVLGTTEPDAQGSFGFNFQYKQFSLYASFMYEFGAQRYNSTLVDKVENVNVYADNVDKRVLKDRWMNPGDKVKYKKISSDRSGPNRTQPTSRFVQNYNSLSLTSMEFRYDLDPEVAKRMHLSMVSFSLGLSDIFHLQSVKMERGLSYPFERAVNFSIKVTL